jgi:hypothetical protein
MENPQYHHSFAHAPYAKLSSSLNPYPSIVSKFGGAGFNDEATRSWSTRGDRQVFVANRFFINSELMTGCKEISRHRIATTFIKKHASVQALERTEAEADNTEYFASRRREEGLIVPERAQEYYRLPASANFRNIMTGPFDREKVGCRTSGDMIARFTIAICILSASVFPVRFKTMLSENASCPTNTAEPALFG